MCVHVSMASLRACGPLQWDSGPLNMPPLGHLSIPRPMAWHLERAGHMLCECMETLFKVVVNKVFLATGTFVALSLS